MSNAKADRLHSSEFLNRIGDSRAEAEIAELRARTLRSQAIAKYIRRAVNAVKGWVAVRRSRRELLQFDDRQLEDIGLNRYEIHDALDANSFEMVTLFTPVKEFVDNVIGFFKGWNARRNSYQQLSALDDHMLEDIGVRRDEIEAIAFRGKVRKPIMHAPVSVDSLRAQAFPDVQPENGNKHIAA